MKMLLSLYSFKGRIARLNYLAYQLAAIILPMAIFLIWMAAIGFEFPEKSNEIGAYTSFALLFAIGLSMYWISIASIAKRLRDIGWNPWWCILFLPTLSMLRNGDETNTPELYIPALCIFSALFAVLLLTPSKPILHVEAEEEGERNNAEGCVVQKTA